MSAKKVTVEEAKNIIRSFYPEITSTRRAAVSKLRSAVVQKNLDLQNEQPHPTHRKFKPLKVDDILKHDVQEHKRSLSAARDLLPLESVTRMSNILLFRTRNQLLHYSDFSKLVSAETSLFDLHALPSKKYDFKTVQARTPDLLLPHGGFYLIFNTADEAAAYMVDTLGKELNGTNFYLEMVDPEEHKYFIHNSKLLEELHSIDKETWELKSKPKRETFVLVRGFPTFVKDTTIEEMLWDYNIDYEFDTPIMSLKKDNISKTSVWLIKFVTILDAHRFARTYNGEHFNSEKRFPKVYASVLH